MGSARRVKPEVYRTGAAVSHHARSRFRRLTPAAQRGRDTAMTRVH